MGWTRGPDASSYVLDVSFVSKDKYGNEVQQTARPCFPVEYLLVDFMCGAAVNLSVCLSTSPLSMYTV